MRKSTLLALAASVPFLAIVARETAKLFGALAGGKATGPSPLLWIAAMLLALLLLWTGVLLWNRRGGAKPAGMPFEMVAAMAIAEAKKRPAAGACPRCRRPRVSENSPRCLYCGEAFTRVPAEEAAPSSPYPE